MIRRRYSLLNPPNQEDFQSFNESITIKYTPCDLLFKFTVCTREKHSTTITFVVHWPFFGERIIGLRSSRRFGPCAPSTPSSGSGSGAPCSATRDCDGDSAQRTAHSLGSSDDLLTPLKTEFYIAFNKAIRLYSLFFATT